MKQHISTPEKPFKFLSAYSILLIIVFMVGISTIICAQFDSRISPASISDILTSPVHGILDGIHISLFLLMFGGCMGIVTQIGAIEAGIKALVSRLAGKELKLVPIVMAVFALLGTSYGFDSEAIPFYALLGAALYAAGYDTLVASATALLGAGVGVLGSTVNPFCTGIAIASLEDLGIPCNTAFVLLIGAALLASAYGIALFCILRYAKRVKQHPAMSLLSAAEKQACAEDFGSYNLKENCKDNRCISTKQRITLILFALSFVVMIIGFIPWQEFDISIFSFGELNHTETSAISLSDIEQHWEENHEQSQLQFSPESSASLKTVIQDKPAWSAWLTGKASGHWGFDEASAWFFIMAIVIAFVGKLSEQQAIKAFLEGAGNMVGVAFIIGFARAISWLMAKSGLDIALLHDAAQALSGLHPFLFITLSFLLYIAISVIITSTSALASLSIPIMGPLAYSLGIPPELMIMIFTAGCGVANLFSPMGMYLPGLMIAHVEYSTWLRWAYKPVIGIALGCLVVLLISGSVLLY